MIDMTRRPYAATANVIAVINRARTRNLPDVVNNDFLRIAGISELVFGRVMQALVFLELVTEDGSPTEKLRGLAGAPESEYRATLAAIVREAYREDFNSIDPTQDAQHTILGHFQRYQPRSQTSRMVMLFLGLCREAEIPVRDAPRERAMQTVTRRPTTSRRNGPRVIRAPAGFVPKFDQPRDGGGSTFFGFSEADMANLSDDDFGDVWAALGKVAHAKFRAARDAMQTVEPEVEVDGDAGAEGDDSGGDA